MVEARESRPTNGGELASSLEPVLRASCGSSLGPIEWFRSTWQRGGASTGFSTWTWADGSTAPAMVKIPVGPTEYRWTTLLGGLESEEWGSERGLRCPTPRVLRSGEVLDGYDLGWIVIERLRDRPLSSEWTRGALLQLLEAVAELHARALRAIPEVSSPADPYWGELIERSREVARRGEIPEGQRWNAALKRVGRVLEEVEGMWRSREISQWCHGDVHPGNACIREHAGEGTCVLIDLSRMRGGHWLEDGLQLEYLHWGHRDQLFGINPVRELRRLRRERGLETGSDSARLADAWRILAASALPGAMSGAIPARRLSGALERLEGVLGRLL